MALLGLKAQERCGECRICSAAGSTAQDMEIAMSQTIKAVIAIGIAYSFCSFGAAPPATAQQSDELLGTILGGAIGGAIGSSFGSGDGRDAATAIGAILGAMEGYEQVKRNEVDARRRAIRGPRSETQVPHASPFLLLPEGSKMALQCEVAEEGVLCRHPTKQAERTY